MPLPARFSRVFTGLFHAVLTLLLIASLSGLQAQDVDQALYDAGEKVFKGNCASCHKPDANMTGPALKGARERWDGKGDIYAWIRNSQEYLKTGNEYANKLFEEWNKSVMTPMALSDEEIDAVLYYADNYAPPAPKGGGDLAQAPTGPTDAGSLWPWMLVLILLFVVVALSLTGVKKSLANAVQEAEGREPLPDRTFVQSVQEWAWNNKGLATVIGLAVTVWVVLALWNFAWTIGVYGGDEVAHYRPEQPIAFNHTLHAGSAGDGNLAINCQYCHSGAEKSKHAGIPTANVCMNCHKSVDAGKKTGTAEIAMTKTFAMQWAREGIRVNSVAPGSIAFEGGSWGRRMEQDPEGMARFADDELTAPTPVARDMREAREAFRALGSGTLAGKLVLTVPRALDPEGILNPGKLVEVAQ